MIRLITDAHVLNDLRCDDLFKAKISSLYNTYGFASFMDYWQSTKGSLIARVDNSFVISSGNSENEDEMSEFIDIVCNGTVLCDFNLKTKAHNANSGMIMKLIRRHGAGDKRSDLNIDNEFIADLHSFLRDEFTLPDFRSFSADIIHRLNKKTIQISAIYRQNRLIACAMASLANGSAVIHSVAVDKNMRRQGIGSAVVFNLTNKLSKCENIFLQCDSEENEAFYKSCGFEEAGKWKEIKGDI